MPSFDLVVPDQGIVAVRQRRYPADPAEVEEFKYNFASFRGMVRELADPPRQPAPGPR